MSGQRNPRIDRLRGLAIVLVVFDHLALRISPQEGVLGAHVPKRILDALFTHGYEGVFIFFVISGFLITAQAVTRCI